MLFRDYLFAASLPWIMVAGISCCCDCCDDAAAEELYMPQETGIRVITLMTPYFVENDGRPPPVRHDGYMDRRTMEYDSDLRNDFSPNAPPRCRSLLLLESRRFYDAETGLVHRTIGLGIDYARNPLFVGDVIPVFGAVARVSEIGIKSQTKQEFVKLEVIPESELPPGVRHPRLWHGIPLKGFGRMSPAGDMHLLAIERVDGEPGFSAKIQMKYEAALPNGITQRTLPERWVRENDVIFRNESYPPKSIRDSRVSAPG